MHRLSDISRITPYALTGHSLAVWWADPMMADIYLAYLVLMHGQPCLQVGDASPIR